MSIGFGQVFFRPPFAPRSPTEAFDSVLFAGFYDYAINICASVQFASILITISVIVIARNAPIMFNI